ncbi:phage portal protein [Micromonospora arida]|uniref:phage portal protein n=1 Tax=Micromonospora arida TaxID=2203715 RepID=UPI003CFA9E7C
MDDRSGHHGLIARYLRGDHDLPYMPRGAKAEYKSLAEKSITNWLPLISATYTKRLFVDGFRAARATDNAKPWEYWQANGMDARQTIVHRGALEYGAAYVLVLPGKPVPFIRPLSPLRTVALYEDEEAEWPDAAMRVKGKAANGDTLLEVFDDRAAHTIRKAKHDGKLTLVRSDAHNLGVVPFVRYRPRLDGESVGIIKPLIRLNDRINESVFALYVALQYASFRQRWATGLAIPVDEDEQSPTYGQPVEPFQAAVDRLWISDNPDAKFGDFGQTDTKGHLETYGSGVRSLAAIAQLSPHVLLGDLVNLSADALAAAESATQHQIGEFETIFGESHEQTLRTAAKAAGDREAAADMSAQVRWRDTEARSLAAAVDALGKMVQMLGVPAEAAWERIPGVTDQDIQRWRGMAASGDGLTALAEALGRQKTPAVTAGANGADS